ncbi:Alkaline phosphatase synthesis sensor protein PhoR [compost metagenome]
MLREVVEEKRPELRQRGLRLIASIPAAPLLVDGEAPRLARVFQQLLDNACKFTPAPGRVRVRAWREPDAVCVSVRDTGIGIAPEHQARIFQKFYQVDSGPARERGGAGLGLALTRALVNAHGGVLMLKSEPGEGATFTVRLPASREAGP